MTKRKKGITLLLFLILFLLIPELTFTRGETRSYAAGTDPQVVKAAKAYKLPKGELTLKNGKYSYVTEKGTKLKNRWIWYRKGVYYLDKYGNAKTGAFAYKGQSYYAGKNGKIYIRKERKVEKRRYYYGSTGAMLRSTWRGYNCEKYYYMANGVMATSRWIGDRYVGRNGQYIAGYETNRIATASFKNEYQKRRLVIVGASRVCDMAEAVSTDQNIIYIARRGRGYNWFAGEAVPRLRKTLDQYPTSKVVIQMGNNDFKYDKSGHFDKYARFYEKLMKEYPYARFYLMDTLPSRPLSKQLNEYRCDFNNQLKKNFPENYIGGYNFMIAHAFETGRNNEHYSPNESRRIYNYILRKVGTS